MIGLVDRPGARHDAIEGGRHPPDDRVLDPALDVLDDASGIAFVPLAIELLGHQPELDDQVGRQVLRSDLAALFLPEADQGLFVLAHNDAGVGAAYEVAALSLRFYGRQWLHRFLLVFSKRT
jgi:hypothetical protein